MRIEKSLREMNEETERSLRNLKRSNKGGDETRLIRLLGLLLDAFRWRQEILQKASLTEATMSPFRTLLSSTHLK